MRLTGIKSTVVKPEMLGILDPEYYASSNRVSTERDAFTKVPLLFRAIRLRCDALTGVPVYVYPLGSDEPTEDWPIENKTLNEWIWELEASLLFKGAAYSVDLRNEFGGRIGGVQVLNPYTVDLIDKRGERWFKQQVSGATREWPEDEVLYLREYNPKDDVGPGVSAAGVALGSSQVQHYVTRFAGQFFESGAMPVVVLGLPNGMAGAERESVETFFKKAMQGIRNAFRVLAVSAEVKPTVITPPISDLDLTGVNESVVRNISWAFDIPKTILTADSANYATAETEFRIFTEKTIVPRCKRFESWLNPYLESYGVEIAFAPEELNEMQEDEKDRASAWKLYVDGGMNPDLAAEILGVDIPDTYSGERWKKPEPKAVAAPVQEPIEDMKKWERKALKRLSEGKPAQVDFESDVLPQELKSLTYNALGIAKSEDDVKLIFRGIA